MVKIRTRDIEEFINIIEHTYGRDCILDRSPVNFYKYEGTYLVNFLDIYYEIEAFEYEKTIGNEYEEKPVRYGFCISYFLFEKIFHRHRMNNDNYITINIPEDKICCGLQGVIENEIDYFTSILYTTDFDEFDKGFKTEINTYELLDYAIKNNKITIKTKIANKSIVKNYKFYFLSLQDFLKFINYFKPDKVVVIYNTNDIFIQVGRAYFNICQWKEEDFK